MLACTARIMSQVANNKPVLNIIQTVLPEHGRIVDVHICHHVVINSSLLARKTSVCFLHFGGPSHKDFQQHDCPFFSQTVTYFLLETYQRVTRAILDMSVCDRTRYVYSSSKFAALKLNTKDVSLIMYQNETNNSCHSCTCPLTLLLQHRLSQQILHAYSNQCSDVMFSQSLSKMKSSTVPTQPMFLNYRPISFPVSFPQKFLNKIYFGTARK